jgi:hypothetical protein
LLLLLLLLLFLMMMMIYDSRLDSAATLNFIRLHVGT